MKGFFRGLLVLTLMVSLAFNGAFYYALEDRKAANELLTSERDTGQARAQEAEALLREQDALLAGHTAQIEQLEQALSERDGQIEQLNRSLGQREEVCQTLEKQLSEQDEALTAFAAQDEQFASQQEELAQIREERQTLLTEIEQLRQQLFDSSFGQEDRVAAIARLQAQLSERGEEIRRLEGEYEELMNRLTEAEEYNAGQAVLMLESTERELAARSQTDELQRQMEALQAQLTLAEENYSGAAATLSEQARALEEAQAQLEQYQSDQKQLSELEGQIAALQEDLAGAQAAAPASFTFTGREIELSFELPEGMLAAEYEQAVYLSQGDAQGVIRALPLDEEAADGGLEQALSAAMDELFGGEERPPVTDMEDGCRFALPPKDEQYGEICLLRSKKALYYLRIDAPTQENAAKALDGLLRALRDREGTAAQ